MEDWIVVATPAGSAHPETADSVTLVPEKEAVGPPALETHASECVKESPECERGPLKQPEPDSQAFSLNDVFRNMSELQRASYGLYDTYFDQLQCKFLEFKDVATSRSRWALERARVETQKALSSLSDPETPQPQPNEQPLNGKTNEPADQGGKQDTTGKQSSSPSSERSDPVELQTSEDLEYQLSKSLIGLLAGARLPLYDGGDFRGWLTKVEPFFDHALPRKQRTSEAFLCGVKLYSIPSVAVAIDEIDTSTFRSWEEARDFLITYFDERRSRLRKYKELLQGRSAA